MQSLLETFQASLGESLPRLFGAILILLVGWLIAHGVRRLLTQGLAMFKLNERLGPQAKKSGVDLEAGLSIGAYYVILLMTLLAVFNNLSLEVASQPIHSLLSSLTAFVPKLAGGGILIAIAYFCGFILRQVVTGSVAATGVDQKIKTGRRSFSAVLGEASFWLVILLFMPGILGVFGLEGLLAPVQEMVQTITAMLPKIMAAGIIVAVGWFVATILRELVNNLLSATGINSLGEKAGVKGKMAVSEMIGMLVYFFIFIPAVIAGLKALQMSAIADPATDMLSTVMGVIPKVLAALAIVGVTFLIARPVSELISHVLEAAGVDRAPQVLGFKGVSPQKAVISRALGTLVFVFLILMATIEAANSLGFGQLSEMVSQFIQFAGKVLLGSAIIAGGVWLANLVHGTMSSSAQAKEMATFVRVVILVLVAAMGLRAMGLANDIVNMAFGISLGSVAVAFALAFGLGGRDVAAKKLSGWIDAKKSRTTTKK